MMTSSLCHRQMMGKGLYELHPASQGEQYRWLAVLWRFNWAGKLDVWPSLVEVVPVLDISCLLRFTSCSGAVR